MSIAQGLARQDRTAAARDAGFWRHARWLERLCLAAPTLLFLRIGWKYLSAPAEVAAGSQMVLGSPAAVTDMRAFGAIFLAFAAIALVALASTRRLLAGLTIATVVVAFATAARVLGMIADGATPETTFKLVAEVVLLALTIAGTGLELRRRRSGGG
jgi:cell shape-determining protein MreD